MLRLVSTLARIVFGLVLASLAAGLVTVLFVNTPIDVLAEPFDRLPKTVGETFDLALLAATHIGIFSSLFVLLTACISEWFSIRSLPFYLLAGVIIAVLGFSAQYASEVTGQPTILNNYAIKAFLTVGFFGGFFYWLAAGQFAGRPPRERNPQFELAPTSVVAVKPSEETADTEVVITQPTGSHTPRRHRMPLLERLSFAKRRSGDGPAPVETNEDEATKSG